LHPLTAVTCIFHRLFGPPGTSKAQAFCNRAIAVTLGNYRDNSNNDLTQWIAAPSLRIDYRWRKRYRFEIEGGGEWSTQELSTETQDSSSWFFSLGYRADF